MSKSKDKSYAHETRIAKLFTKWAGKEFMRTPASGSMRWGGSRWIYADIVPPEYVPILCECKHHAELSIENLLIMDNKIVEWWNQTIDSHTRAEKDLGILVFPCMTFKRDYSQDFLVVPNDFVSPRIRSFNFTGIFDTDVAIVNLKSFLEVYTPEDVREYLHMVNVTEVTAVFKK